MHETPFKLITSSDTMNVFQFSLRIIVAEYGNALQYNYMTLKFLVFLNSSQIFFNEDYAALIAVWNSNTPLCVNIVNVCKNRLWEIQNG